MSNLMAFGASDGIQVSVRASTSSRWSAMTSWMSAAFRRAERAISSQVRHVSTIGKIVKQQYVLQMSPTIW